MRLSEKLVDEYKFPSESYLVVRVRALEDEIAQLRADNERMKAVGVEMREAWGKATTVDDHGYIGTSSDVFDDWTTRLEATAVREARGER